MLLYARFLSPSSSSSSSSSSSFDAIAISMHSPTAKQAIHNASKVNASQLATWAAAAESQTDWKVHQADGELMCESNKYSQNLLCLSFHARALTVDLRQSIMDLMISNMKAMYQAAQAGWDEQEKADELFDEASRFLIIKSKEGTVIAFANWRFDIEECEEDDPCARKGQDQVEVLYCYEVQVSSSFRQYGIGRLLMSMLESIARHAKMRKIMLTVFLHNQAALRFYHKLGYGVDLISPSQYEISEGDETPSDYEIMSKAVK